MALSAAVIWEVRSATGSDSNGGAFDPSVTSPGTDYSQQGTAEFSFTDGTASGTAAFTSASHSFTSADVGNMINISAGSGFTTGFYMVVSVSSGTATLDRSPGTGTAATWALGGALLTLTTAVGAAIPSNIVYCSGSETKTSALSIPQNGASTPGTPFTITGYTSVRTDGGRFTLTTSTNSIDLVDFTNGSNQILIQNLLIQSTAGTPGNGVYGSTFAGRANNIVFNNCRITGFSVGFTALYAGPEYFLIVPLVLNNCEIDHCSSGLSIANVTFILNCYIHDNVTGIATSGSGNQDSTALTCVTSVFYNNSGNGVNLVTNYPALFQNCAFANNGNGVDYASGSYDTASFINCIFYGNTIALTCGGGGVLNGLNLNCAYGANTTDISGILPAKVGAITLTADPFTNRTGGDFTLNSTSGGGTACKGAGFQSTLV